VFRSPLQALGPVSDAQKILSKKEGLMEERQKGDGEKESTDTEWPKVRKIARSEEFQQSFAVAQQAVKLCELKGAQSTIPLQKDNLDPAKFLEESRHERTVAALRIAP
jgi:hypothetical protein